MSAGRYRITGKDIEPMVVDAGSVTAALSKVYPKLTSEQRKRVREIMVDEGNTRAEAIAWVLAFGVSS